jgi:hypothetical protein
MKSPLTFLLSLPFLLTLSLHAQNQQEPATLRSLLLHELHTTHTEADWFVPINTLWTG